MNADSLKKCRRCGFDKPATTKYFPPSKGAKSGLHAWCRDCFRVKARAAQTRRYWAKKAAHDDAHNELSLPQARTCEENLPGGIRRVRFGMGFRPEHKPAGVLGLSGYESGLARVW